MQAVVAEMRQRGCVPDTVTYNILLFAHLKADVRNAAAVDVAGQRGLLTPRQGGGRACMHARAGNTQDTEGVQRWHDAMEAERVRWDTYTYNAHLAALVRAGRLDDAWSLFRDMDAPADHVTFHIIIREHGAPQ